MLKGIKKVQEGLAEVAFPNVCLCCGHETVQKGNYLCTFCLNERFEDANPEHKMSASGVILPDIVAAQQALWQFDKGGDLQKLIHALKYDRLTSIGVQMGRALAARLKQHPFIQEALSQNHSLIVPVPLHYLKFRKRGFNQAFFIASGINEILDLPICGIDMVRRKKYTQSQTGFNLERRIKNMENAFRASKPKQITGKTIIIVDDVFTTGSTAFELSRTLKQAGAETIMIWTVAQA